MTLISLDFLTIKFNYFCEIFKFINKVKLLKFRFFLISLDFSNIKPNRLCQIFKFFNQTKLFFEFLNFLGKVFIQILY